MSSKNYQEELFEHFKYPCNKKCIENPDFQAGHDNPSCGDKVTIEGKILGNKIIEVGFSGSGCVISQAATSMLTEYCKGKTIDEILALTKDDILNLVKIELGPNRLKCALLCLQVLQEALLKFKSA
ncbi:MAG: iron-sulfur cluster assembly scaffold protein, partial [Candidatus Babeliales bacterium]